MAFSLRNKFEEALAQVNPFDGGKTAATVKASRPTPPAQTVAKPKQNLGNIGATIQSGIRQVTRPAQNIARNTQAVRQNAMRPVNNTAVKLMQSPVNNAYTRHLAGANLGTARSVVGQAEGLSGLYDLVTPGTGTNRFTQATRRAGAGLDKLAERAGKRDASYTGGQVATELASFLIPGAVSSKVTKVPQVANFTSRGSNLLNKAPRVANVVRKTAPMATNVLADTVQGAGIRTARGEDNSAKTAGIDAGMSLATAGALTGGSKLLGKGARYIKKSVNDIRSENAQRAIDWDNTLKWASNRGSFYNGEDYPQLLASVRRMGLDPTSPDVWTKIDRMRASQGGYIKNPLANDAPQQLYRGGKEPIDASKMTERGISLSTDKETAKWFAGYDDSKVESLNLSPQAKILKWDDVPSDLRSPLEKPLSKSKDIKSSVPEEMAIVNYARSNGYDGVAFGGKYSEGEVRIINPDVLIKQSAPQVGKTLKETQKVGYYDENMPESKEARKKLGEAIGNLDRQLANSPSDAKIKNSLKRAEIDFAKFVNGEIDFESTVVGKPKADVPSGVTKAQVYEDRLKSYIGREPTYKERVAIDRYKETGDRGSAVEAYREEFRNSGQLYGGDKKSEVLVNKLLDSVDRAEGKIPTQIKVNSVGKEKPIKVERIPVNLKDVDPERMKDINGLEAQAQDLWRNTEKVFGKDSPVARQILDPLDNAKGRFIDDQDNYAGQLKESIVDGLNIKKGSKESAAIQEFGEGSRTFDQLVEEFGEKRANDIVKADKWFRQAYDQILDEVNEQRMRIYNGNQDKLIPKRKDYYRHFTEMQDGFQGLMNIFETPAGISSSLSGISQYTKPKSKWLSFAQQRLGNKTDVDAVGGFLDYLRASSYAKNIDPEITRLRKVREQLAEATAEGQDAGKINTYLEFLDDYANDLAGKTNPADRFVQKVTGRKVMGALNWINRRAKSNAILGNFSSSVAQVFGVPLGLGDVQSPKAIYAGSKDYFKSLSGGKTDIDKSTFIKERYSNIYDKFDEGIIKNSKKFAAWMVGVGDEVATKWIWHAQHNKALEQGLKGADAIRFADGRTRAVVAGRGVGEVPLLQKSKVFQMVAPFQLEVGNQWLVFKDWKGEGSAKLIKGLVTYSIAAAIMNKGAEQVRGNDVAFDPLDALADAWGELTTDEVDSEGNAPSAKERVGKAAGRLGGEVLGNVPGGAYAANAIWSDPFKRKEIFGDEDPSRFGTSPLAVTSTVGAVNDIIDRPTDWRAYSKAITGLGTPFAGKQIDRSLNAIVDQAKGFTTSASGAPKFTTEESPLRRAQAVLFGSNSTPNARSYYNNDQRPLSDTQTEKLNTLPKEDRKGFIESVMAKRSEGKTKANYSDSIEAIKEKKKNQTENFKSQFSDDDYAILAMDENERQAIIDQGIKSQADLDGLDRYALQKRRELGMDAGGKGQPLPKDIDGTDDKVKEFYNDRSYIHDMDYDTWQTSAPDSDSGKDLIRRVNQLKPEGLPELPQNNRTAEMYAEFVKKRAQEKWSPTIENNQKKKLLRDIYGTQVSQEEKTLLSQSDSVIRASLVSGEIDQETMNKLVEIDNLNAMLGGSAQIGKTLRREYGYPLAPTSSSSTGTSTRSSRTPAYKSPYEGTADSLANRRQLRNLLSKYA